MKGQKSNFLDSFRWSILLSILILGSVGACASFDPGSPAAISSTQANVTLLKAKEAGAERYSPSYLKAAEENLARAQKSRRESETQDLALKAKIQAEIALAQSRERLIEQQIAQTEKEISQFKFTKERYMREEAQIKLVLSVLHTVRKKAEQTEKEMKLTYDQVTQFVEDYLSQILFEPNETKLSPAAMQNLLAVANTLKDNPNMKVAISGFSSSEGPEEYNIKLSKDRADKVANFLVAAGVLPDQIASIEAYGDTMPAISNDTEIGRRLNRRVEIEIIPAEKQPEIKNNEGASQTL